MVFQNNRRQGFGEYQNNQKYSRRQGFGENTDCGNREVKLQLCGTGLAACHTNRNAGTGMCVHISFRLDPIASLAWL